MSSGTFTPAQKEDFNQVYNLPDPRPYYAGLVATDYRCPEVVANVLRSIGSAVVAARDGEAGEPRALRVIDFACGFGAVGAILRHDITMVQLYAYYAASSWQLGDGSRHREADRQYYAGSKLEAQPAVEITGLDIVGNALDYAAQMGFIDATADENLVDEPPSQQLQERLAAADLVIEAGAVGEVTHLVYGQILASGARPWFLRCPKPDVDWTSLTEVLDKADYVSEQFSGPLRYRKALGAEEDARVRALAKKHGISADDALVDGYIAIRLTLSRPAEDAARCGIGEMGLEKLCAGCFD
jgi:hypothetical protein